MTPPIPMAAEDLTEAERYMVLAAARGEPVDLKRHTVRGSIVRDLALEARPGWTIPEAGLRLNKAIIEGGLDLEGCTLNKPLLFWHSRIEKNGDKGAVILRDGRIKRLGIHSCTVEGAIVADRALLENGFFLGGGLVKGVLQVRGARIDGALAIEGTQIGDGKSALLAAGLSLSGPLILRRAEVKGEVAFPRANLEAGIYAEDCTIVREGTAVNGESARIAGDVLLDRAKITGSLSLLNARIGGQLAAEGLVVAATPKAILADGLSVGQGVNLSSAGIAGSISLMGASVGKTFRAEAAEVWGEEQAIAADMIVIGGNWNLARAKIVGELNMPGADISGQLRLTEARLMGKDIAIRADGVRIRGGCFLSRANVHGLMRFPAAEIGNQFRLRGATLRVEQGAALLASGSTFNRDVEAGGGLEATGALVFDHAKVKGAFDLDGSRLRSAALGGAVRDAGAGAAQDEDVPGGRLDALAFSVVDAEIDRLTMPSRAEDRPRGIVDLSRAHVDSFADFADAWPPSPLSRGRDPRGRDIDHLVLDGFVYRHLSNPSGVARRQGEVRERARRAGERRIAWLEGQSEDILRQHFKPQAWVQLSNSLAAEGYHEDARAIQIARRRREARSRSTKRLERLQGRLLDVLALYGYNPWRTVVWMAVFILLFAGVFSGAASYCREDSCLDESVFVVQNRDAYTPDKLAATYPPFNALAYSFDVFVPFVSFGYEDHWRPNTSWTHLASVPVPGASLIGKLAGSDSAQGRLAEISLGGLLYVAMVIEMILGLVLTSLAITGFTGLLRSDE